MRLSIMNHGPMLSTLYKEHFVLPKILDKMLAKAEIFLNKYDSASA